MSEKNGKAKATVLTIEAGEHVEALRITLGARAAGLWFLKDDRLEMAAFSPAPDMPGEVARRFREAARVVTIDRVELGIVNAVVEHAAAISLAGSLPVETGSGFWLRAFGAERSVAVPIFGPTGAIRAVLSAALPTLGPPDDEEVAELIRHHGLG